MLYGKRDEGSDYVLTFKLPMVYTIIGEVIYTDFGDSHGTENGIYMFGIVESNIKLGVK